MLNDILTIDDFFKEIRDDFAAVSEISGVQRSEIFLETYSVDLENSGEIDGAINVINDGLDSTRRWKINGYLIQDQTTNSLAIFSVVFSDADTAIEAGNLTKTEIEAEIKRLRKFVEVVLTKNIHDFFEITSDVYRAANNIKENWSEIQNIKFFIISNKKASERIKEISTENVDSKKASVHIWDLNRFHELVISGKEREEIVIDFSENPIDCLVTSQSNDEISSLLTVLKGDLLSDLYEKWGSRLLEQNVRSYLQARGKVNKGMFETIKNYPERFFAYNNGLTATAEEIKFVDETKTAIAEIKNLQIVNGGQTTASIFTAKNAKKYRYDVSKISVQMKLNLIRSDKIDELVPKIAEFANTQNKVSAADLFSNHPFHQRMEEFSRRIRIPAKPGTAVMTYWFYERARGQYLNMQSNLSSAKKREFLKQNPKVQKLTKEDLAKIENTWRCFPHEVSKGNQANFVKFAKSISEEWDKNKSEFNEEFFKRAVVHSVIFRSVDSYIKKNKVVTGNYNFVLTYTISLFSKKLREKNKFLDYKTIYNEQICPEDLLIFLKEIALKVNTYLEHEMQNQTTNITSIVRSPKTWNDIADRISPTISLNSIDKLLINVNEYEDISAEAKKNQKIDDVLNLSIKFLTFTLEQWQNLDNFLKENDDLVTDALLKSIEKAKNKKDLRKTDLLLLNKLTEEYEDLKGPI